MPTIGFFDAKVTDRLVQTAHQYLCKPCNPTELKEAISRALFLQDLLANEHLKQFVSQIHSLPGLPSLYTELMIELQRAAPSLASRAKVPAGGASGDATDGGARAG